jgi:hypothetical protein
MQEFLEEPPSARVLTHAMNTVRFTPAAANEAEVLENDTISSGIG